MLMRELVKRLKFLITAKHGIITRKKEIEWPETEMAKPTHTTLPKLASIENPFYDVPIDMDTVTLSPKFQVVIPQAIREALHLTAGEKLRVIRYAGRVEFIPVRPIQQMRGFLRGMDTRIEREEDRL